MPKSPSGSHFILWVEEQYEEYEPLLGELQDLVGSENVILASTEEEGRSQLAGRFFDLVILDLMLPRNEAERQVELIRLEAGLRLLRELRNPELRVNKKWATNHNCNVVVLTARGQPEALKEVETLLNSRGHLFQKPVPIEDLEPIMRNMIDSESAPNEPQY